ncbi:MAG TPA: DUF5676 family membrane protein [Mizugakiibacter sp.]
MSTVMSSSGTAPASRSVGGRHVPVFALGMSLSLFLVISYLICILGYLVLPGAVPIVHSALTLFLPGFTLLSWPSFLLGLLESAAWGWYVAVVFAPLYNFFAARA